MPYVADFSPLQCRRCGARKSYVISTRDTSQGVRRVRECAVCGTRYHTIERPPGDPQKQKPETE